MNPMLSMERDMKEDGGKTENMVEKVALAIHKSVAGDPNRWGYVGDAQDLTDVVIDDRVDLIAVARAAIEAMREPTQDMGLAVSEGCGEYGCCGDRAFEHWQAMIDAALKPDP